LTDLTANIFAFLLSQ